MYLREKLVSRGLEFATFTPTETGLKKSILDATATIRSLFMSEDFHNYQQQGQGPENKKLHSAIFVFPDRTQKTRMSLYRPETKKGDPRMWFTDLKGFAKAGDSVAIFFIGGTPHLLNLSTETKKQNECLKTLDQLLGDRDSIATELLNKLKVLAQSGPIRARNVQGDTSIGMAIEEALGIAANSSKQPDYKGIELKSTRSSSKTRNTLFAQVADWKISKMKSSKEILEAYGYQREDNFKLYCTISTRQPNPQGLMFQLREEEDLLLHEVHTDDGDVAAWRAQKLIERLKEKHSETFWIKADTTFIEGHEHFILQSVIHTRAPLTSQLIPLINEGAITMDHLIKRSPNGRVSEKGPLFKIHDKALPLLFPQPVEYDL